jgi:hypothetical protein
MAEQVTELAGPYEIFELVDGEVRQLRITSWQTGAVTIYPPHKPGGKVVTALRVHVPEDQKDFFPYYWDITGKTLVAQMVPFLEQPGYQDKVFTVTKHGVAPKARFSLKVGPA